MVEPEPQETLLPGAAAVGGSDEEDVVPQATTSSPAKGVAPKRRRRRASVMEMIDEVSTATKDQDGRVNMVDRAGFDKLCHKMGLRLTSAQRSSAFRNLDTKGGGGRDGMLNFAMVHAWARGVRGSQLRETRRLARTLFEMTDNDKSGFLDKSEVIQVEERLRRRCPDVVLDPPFDADADFAMMDLDGQGFVSWNEFESWWMTRTGDEEPTCPVLPESIVSKIDQVCEGSELKGWAYLSERLKVLVDLQRLWGSITELYKLGSSESLYTQDVLPPGIRGPDSVFTRYWDFAQMLFIFWVAVVVPYRLGFDITVELWSSVFWIDAAIDLFFITDLVLNFRTAYYLPTGLLETNVREIRRHYLRTWFVVDFIASLPMTYISAIDAQLSDEEVMSEEGSRLVRSTRIIRLSKLLRVARLKRIIGRHGSMVEFTAYVNSMFTFMGILYAAHLVACGWYFVSTMHEQSWILRNEFQPVYSGSNGYKYSMSLYTAFKLGEGLAYTSEEATFAFASEMVISLIYGALAGVMSTIMMAGSVGEQEYLVKLAQLKAWMKARHLTTRERYKIMGYFSAMHQSSSYFDEAKILTYLPLGVARDLSMQLYETILGESPLFANLGPELMLRICQAVTPVRATAGQTIYEQGKIGSEMYFVMSGELEVIVDGERLGFLGQGSFFGENAVIESIDRKPGLGAEVRLRTMKASADSELGMLAADDVLRLCDTFPELEIRMQSFNRAGSKLSEKGHNAREIRELKRRALLRTQGKGMNSPGTGRASARSSGKSSPGFRSESYTQRQGRLSPGSATGEVRKNADGIDERVLNGSNHADKAEAKSSVHRGSVRSTRSDSASPDGSPTAVSPEEDARAQRVAEAAASLIPGGPSSSDPRPARVEFDGIKPNGADMDILDVLEGEENETAMGQGMTSLQRAMDQYYNTSPRAAEDGEFGGTPTSASAHQVPASVYLAVANSEPWSTSRQLEAAERLLRACDGHDPVAMRRLMEAGDRRARIAMAASNNGSARSGRSSSSPR